MRNLLLFFTRNYYFLLFLSLETLSIFLAIRNNHFQRSQFINSSNVVAGNVMETYSNITDYFALKEVNKNLSRENSDLRNQLPQSFINFSAYPTSVNDSAFHQQYQFITAKVINNSTRRKRNYLTLNRGSKQGIKSEMGVICGDGIVGIVRAVSENFSSVMSVLHENSRIPVTIKKFGENSILNWNGDDETIGKMERVPSHLEIKKGDTIVTSFYSSIFPTGIMVGTIEGFEKVAGNTFFDVDVKLSTNFNQLAYVYVINNLMREEQVKLEKTSQQ
ncbi:MAG: rod shape-determining protein MreC [Bacteroidota bacterium]